MHHCKKPNFKTFNKYFEVTFGLIQYDDAYLQEFAGDASQAGRGVPDAQFLQRRLQAVQSGHSDSGVRETKR